MATTTKKPAVKTAPAKENKTSRAASTSTDEKTLEINQDTRNALQRRGEMVGIVVSDKMQKTIVVRIDRRVRDSFYNKYTVRSRKFKAHDEKNDAKTGDLVSLVESRPLSREKRWVLQSIIRRGSSAALVNVD